MCRTFTLILLLILACQIALAHPGNTDSKGGHTNRSTGEYHYHHGYSAHQHNNGECPYDFKDKTGESSGSSSKASQLYQKNTVKPSPSPKPTPSIKETAPASSARNERGVFVGALIFVILFILIKLLAYAYRQDR